MLILLVFALRLCFLIDILPHGAGTTLAIAVAVPVGLLVLLLLGCLIFAIVYRRTKRRTTPPAETPAVELQSATAASVTSAVPLPKTTQYAHLTGGSHATVPQQQGTRNCQYHADAEPYLNILLFSHLSVTSASVE